MAYNEKIKNKSGLTEKTIMTRIVMYAGIRSLHVSSHFLPRKIYELSNVRSEHLIQTHLHLQYILQQEFGHKSNACFGLQRDRGQVEQSKNKPLDMPHSCAVT